MIGVALHLCQRAVDRLAGADVASLRVTLAALSARVAAAEGEAARLRKEAQEALQWRGVAASVEREAAEDRARLEEVIRERDAARAEVERLTREQGELRQRFHEVLRELGQTRVSAHATAEYAGKAEQLRHDLATLRAAVRSMYAGRCGLRAVLDLLPAEGTDGG